MKINSEKVPVEACLACAVRPDAESMPTEPPGTRKACLYGFNAAHIP